MRTVSSTDAITIILEGDIEHLTAGDEVRVQQARDELASRHEGGKIIHQSSKRSGYHQLKISWVSKPKLED